MPSKDTATATGRNNLLQRKLTWYARYFVPLALQSAFGKKEVQRTLQTRDKMEARRRLPTALSQLQREVAEAVRKRMPLDLSSAAVVLEELESIEAAVRRGEYSVSADPMDLDPVELAVENLLDQHSAHLGGRDPVSGHSRLITHQVWAAAEHTLRVHQDPRYKPLSEWIRLHIEALKSKGRKRSTYLARERHLGDFLEWAGASRDPRTFSDEDVVTYADRLNDKSASVRSRRDTAGHVRAFFEWLKKNRRIVPNNPFADLRDQINGDPSEEGTNKREWEAEELRRILTGFHSSGRLWTIAVIALYSGMRINEVCSLELKDITNRGMEVTKRNAKNMNSERVVPIHPIIAPLVAKLRTTSYDDYLISGIKRAGQDLRRGAYPSKRFSQLRQRLGLTDLETSFHSLRHNFSTAAWTAGILKPTIQLLMGHSRQSISLDRYSDGPEFGLLCREVARISHDRAEAEERPAVAIDALVMNLLVGYRGNESWKGRKQVRELAC